MIKGESEIKSVSYTLGYEGSGEIKKIKSTFKSSFTGTVSYTVSASQTCAAWTTMNWRPYANYWLDNWYGKMKITTIIPDGIGGVYQNARYEDHYGTNKVEHLKTHKVRARENSSKSLTAPTPVPPKGAHLKRQIWI